MLDYTAFQVYSEEKGVSEKKKSGKNDECHLKISLKSRVALRPNEPYNAKKTLGCQRQKPRIKYFVLSFFLLLYSYGHTVNRVFTARQL